MSTIDPTTIANQLATAETQPFRALYQRNLNDILTERNAVNEIESSLKTFQDAVSQFKSQSNFQEQTASSSDDSVLTVQRNGSTNSNFATNLSFVVTSKASSQQNLVSLTPPLASSLSINIQQDTSSDNLILSGDISNILDQLADFNNDQNKNTNVSASIISNNGNYQLILESETGSANNFTVNNAPSTEIQSAQDASIQIGTPGAGAQLLTSSTNTFNNLVPGYDITVESISSDPVDVTIANDPDATTQKVQDLVDSYNSVLQTIGQYTATGNENERRGILAGDSLVRNVTNQINNIFRGSFNGERLFNVGVEFDEKGSLSLNSAKFNDALNNGNVDLDELFLGPNSFIDSLDDTLNSLLSFNNSAFASRKEFFRLTIERIEDRQFRLEDTYNSLFDRYVVQFSQMNNIINQMNQTSSLFTGGGF